MTTSDVRLPFRFQEGLISLFLLGTSGVLLFLYYHPPRHFDLAYAVFKRCRELLWLFLCVSGALVAGKWVLRTCRINTPPIVSIFISAVLGAFILTTLASMTTYWGFRSAWISALVVLAPMVLFKDIVFALVEDIALTLSYPPTGSYEPLGPSLEKILNHLKPLQKWAYVVALVLAVIFLTLLPIRNADFTQHFFLAFKGFFGSVICVFSALVLGRRTLALLKLEIVPEVRLVIACVIGIILFAAVTTVLALVGWAYSWLIASLIIGTLIFSFASLPVTISEVSNTLRLYWGDTLSQRIIVLLTTPFLAYSFLACVVSPYMSDTLSYHLVIPRNILWDHKFIYNPFAYQAGLTSGWHLFGLVGLVMGGDRGLTVFFAWAFLGLVLLIFGAVARQYGKVEGAFLACVGAIVTSTIIDTNAQSGTDVPLGLLIGTSLVVASQWVAGSVLSRSILFGLCIGFAMSTKLTALFPALAIGVFYLYGLIRADRIKAFVSAVLISALIAGVWPVVNLANTGSPLPQSQFKLRTQGPALAQLVESNTYFFKRVQQDFFGQGVFYQLWGGIFGDAKLINNAKHFYVLLVAGFLFALPITEFRRDRFVLLLSLFAIFSYFFVAFTSPVVRFQLRYNLPSILALGMVTALGWRYVLLSIRLENQYPLCVLTVIFSSFFIPSLQAGALFYSKDFQKPAGARTAHIECYDWIAKNLPPDSVIAGTAIMTYYAQRKYLEMQAISQEQIDLSLPPEQILTKLISQGVTHIHLSTAIDLQPWMNELSNKWLRSFRAIPNLPGVKLLYKYTAVDNFFYGKSVEAVYKLPRHI